MFESVKVHDWMTTPVITILPNTPLNVSREIMEEHGVRRLIVAENGQMLGILTIGDVREASPSDATTLSIWELNYLWSQLTAQQVMTHSTFTISPEASITEAAEMMLEHKISGLPVVNEKGSLVGIISEADIFRFLVKSRVAHDVTLVAPV